ncbi:MAG: Hsp20/alpha crystallin family protein [Deltaproteobacteria bacterium]|nr:Hsp20/alpha crystallin family protein [Deltaproteobacteria bacterium]
MSDLHLWHMDELNKLRRDMQELFDCLVRDFCKPFDLRMPSQEPELHVEVTADAIVVTLRAPELKPETLHFAIQGRWLFIRGDRIDADARRRTVIRRSFATTVQLPCPVRGDKVVARFDDGVLRIHLPNCPAPGRSCSDEAPGHNERGGND